MKGSPIITAIHILLTVGSVLFLMCTTDKVTGPGGSETVNTYAMVVISEDKEPVHNAKVRFIYSEQWLENLQAGKEVTAHTFLSNEEGKIAIDKEQMPQKYLNLLIDDENSGRFIPHFDPSGKTDTVVLVAHAFFQGRFENPDSLPKTVRLQGTDYLASVDQVTGKYSFSGVAPGSYEVLTETNGRYLPLAQIELERSRTTELNIEHSDSLPPVYDSLLVLNENMRPAENARVRFVDSEQWVKNVQTGNEVAEYTFLSNEQGIVILNEKPRSTSYNLVIDSENEGAFIPDFTISDESNDTVALLYYSTLKVLFENSDSIPDYLFIEGSDYQAESVLPGEFIFNTIAPGVYRVFTMFDDSLSFLDTVHLLKSDTTEIVISNTDLEDSTGVLIDDFNDGTRDNMLVPELDLGTWYIVKCNNVQVTFPQSRETDTSYIPPEDALVTEGAYEGRSLNLHYNVPSEYFYLIIGSQISASENGLEGIEAVTFRAKGNDHLTLRLHGEEGDNRDFPQASFSVELSSEWTQFVVTPDRFHIWDQNSENPTWESVAGRLQWISFMPEGFGDEIWLDDIRLEGVTLGDLVE
ncbi:hypothetical protein QA601_07270 [Chitinispirillales bacterium ANBcel5]|uniref:hypothetical protein n=1 Tax=Cellulosispirillum alkaliphilum TaxID=3039283 RepID=UPI002A4E3CE1|nr:hypothetical protein [Chitinispirillales bacterium ANBcel5]